MYKKILILSIAFVLVASLISCKVPPITNPGDTTNPGDPPPPGDTTNPGTDIPQQPALKDDEIEKTTEHIVGNGKFVFYEHKYDYANQNLVLMDVKNETDTNYTLTIHYTFYDEAGNELLSKSREFIGFAAGWQRPILLWGGMAFDSYSYTIETTPYEGECHGVNHSVEYIGLREFQSAKTFLIADGLETNTNTSAFWRCLTIILFDNQGNVYGIYPCGYENYNLQIKDLKFQPFTPYSASKDEFVWPENLKGDLRCVIIPYYGADKPYLYENSDHHIFFPDSPPLKPDQIPNF